MLLNFLNWFNNRELAIGFWLICFLLYALTSSKVHHSFLNVIKATFQRTILTIFLSMVIYVVSIIFFLYKIKFWDISLLKGTIFWFIFSAVSFQFRVGTNKNDARLFRNLINDSTKIIVVFEFIVNSYTFSLIGEFVFIPIITFVALITMVANLNNEYKVVAKFFEKIQIIIGAFIIIYATYNVVVDYSTISSIDSLRSFALPIVLTILLLPFLYLLQLYILYESLFNRLNMGVEKSADLKRYARWKIFRYCLIDTRKLQKLQNMRLYNLMQVSGKSEVDDLILNCDNA